MNPTIETVNESNKSELQTFLKCHENYTLFLLSNLEVHGFALTDAPNSGNFKLIRHNNAVAGAFCLTRRGNLLIQSEIQGPELFKHVLQSCKEERPPLTGLIGEWSLCAPFWNYLKEKSIIDKDLLFSKEILYSLDLHLQQSANQSNVRLLTPDDYIQWRPLRLGYLKGEGIPLDISEEMMHDEFLNKTSQKIIWGHYIENQLVSTADLNAKARDLGQVGGVFTLPSFRHRGLAKTVLLQLIQDVQSIHGIRKLIIFTGTGAANLPARKLYESLNAKPVGYYALIFGT